MTEVNKTESPQSMGQRELVQLLRADFVVKCRKNPAYSLRAYAKYLGVDQSNLSKILSGQRGISSELTKLLCEKVGLNPAKIEKRLFHPSLGSEFSIIEEDQFEFVSDWLHFALLEYSKLKRKETDAKRIAGRFAVRVEEVQACLERLERLGFIKLSPSGRWTLLRKNNTWTSMSVTSGARRKLQRILLEKSLTALDGVPLEQRDHGSLTVAVSKRRLPEFKQKLAEVRKELGEFFQSDGNFDEVYQLTINLFPLTRNTGE